jgi:hypothetical protein
MWGLQFSPGSIWRIAGGNVVNDPSIQFSPSAIEDDASVGDDVGTATVSGVYTGTPTWALDDDASGKYSINSSTGLIEVAASLTAGTDSITISVSGLTPSPDPRSFNIPVTAAGSGTAGQPIGLLLTLTKAA